MESFGLLLYLLVTVLYMCHAASTSDIQSSTLPSHDMDLEQKETNLRSSKVSVKQPFPLNNLKNCNGNDEKGPLYSLSGGLLPSLLSVLSKSHSLVASKSGSGNGDNCEYDEESFSDSPRSFKADSKSVDSKTASSANSNELPGLHAEVLGRKGKGKNDEFIENQGTSVDDSKVKGLEENKAKIQSIENEESPWDDSTSDLSRYNEENNVNGLTTKNKDDADVSNRDNEVNNSEKQSSIKEASLVNNGDVLNRASEENNFDDQTTANEGSLMSSDVLSEGNEENNFDGQNTGNGRSLVSSDFHVLNGVNEENGFDDQTTENGRSLVSADVDVLNGNKEEKGFDDQNTENGRSLVSADVDVLNGNTEENSSDEQTTDNDMPLVDADVDILSRESEKYNSDDQTTENDEPLLDADVDVLNGEQPLTTGVLGEVLGRFVPTVEDLTNNIVNLKKNNDNKKDNHNKFNMNKENSDTVDATNKNTRDNEKSNYCDDQITPLMYSEKDSNDIRGQQLNHDVGNDNNIAGNKEGGNMKTHDKNEGSEAQTVSQKVITNDNEKKNVDVPLEDAAPNHESFSEPANQYYLERDDDSTNNPGRYARVWPFLFGYQMFPGEYIISSMPLGGNIEDGNINSFQSNRHFSQRRIPSKRFLPFGILPQNEHPSIPQFPQSVAGSSLYGSYAKAETIPVFGYGGLGGGMLGGLGTSSESSGTSVESSETTVETSETSVSGSGTSV